METIQSRRVVSAVVLLLSVTLVFMAAFFIEPKEALSAENSSAMTGYLWSDTIGWIDLNCLNTTSCGVNPFGISVASDGALSGYAWSENIGWVSANSSDVSGCPSGTCAPRLGEGVVSGWLRAISGGTSQSGSWDGFISLSGTGYGVTKESGAAFSGYAWGDTNVGWVDFSRAQLTATCVSQNMCVGNTYSYQDAYCQISTIKTCTASCTLGGCSEDLDPPTATLVTRPSIVRLGGTVRVVWTSTDATSCMVSGNGDLWSATASPQNGYVSSPINTEMTYTLSCTGDGGSVQKEVIVHITPAWTEI